MEWIAVERKKLSFSRLEVCAGFAGDDVLLYIGGGEQHLGSVVQAVPRISLSGNGEVSCTSSVLNLTGHKDESICRMLAERVCVQLQTVTVCTGGFHVDAIEKEQIREVLCGVEELAACILNRLRERLKSSSGSSKAY